MANPAALIEVDHIFKTYPVADRGERVETERSAAVKRLQ